MKTIIALTASSLLVAAIFTVAFTNVALADKPQSLWCYRDVTQSLCYDTHKECKTASDASVTQDKCQKFP